jgi:predicted Zn-dependent protease
LLKIAAGFLLLLLGAVATGSEGVLCEGEWERAHASFLRIQKEWPLRPQDDPVVAHVQRLAALVARRSRSNLAWHIYVVRNLVVNAFSIGGGYIFVTEGALKLAQNESELAAIFAHEMGHELAGHFCQPPPVPDLWATFSSLFGGGEANYSRGAQNRDLGSLTQVINLDKEKQADRLGVDLLYAAAYDPHAMLDVARRLPSSGAALHLHDTRRIAALEQLLMNISPQPSPSSREFREMKQFLSGR